MSIEEPLGILFFTFFGASAILILGCKIASDSFFLLFPKSIKLLLSAVGKHHFLNSLGGGLIAFLAQSPISATNMATSFGNSGLFTRNQVSAILSGVGFAALWPLWIIVFNWGWYELIFLSFGAFFVYLFENDKALSIGRFLFGMGLFILGSRMLKVGLASQPQLSFVFYQTFFSGSLSFSTSVSVLALILVVVFLSRSFLVPLALTLTLFEADYISGNYATLFLIFIFFGLSLLPLLSWKKYSTEVKRAVSFQVVTKLCLTLLLLMFSEVLYEWCREMSTSLFLTTNELHDKASESLITVHVIPFTFLVLNFVYLIWSYLVFVPLNSLVDKMILSTKVKEHQKLIFIGETHNVSSYLSIEQVKLELKKMAAMVDSMLQLSQEVLGSWQPKTEAVQKILKYEAVTDRLQEEMNLYLSKLMRLSLTNSQGRKIKNYLRMTKELENIADCCKALFYLQQNMVDSGRLPSKESIEMLREYFSEILTNYELLFTDITDDEESVFSDKTADEYFRTKSLDLNARHLDALKKIYSDNKAESTSYWAAEMLFKFDQIHGHTSNLYEAYRNN